MISVIARCEEGKALTFDSRWNTPHCQTKVGGIFVKKKKKDCKGDEND